MGLDSRSRLAEIWAACVAVESCSEVRKEVSWIWEDGPKTANTGLKARPRRGPDQAVGERWSRCRRHASVRLALPYTAAECPPTPICFVGVIGTAAALGPRADGLPGAAVED